MKMKWSAILSLLLLFIAGCGKEQFGSTPTTNTSKANAVVEFQQSYCEKPTVIPPKVDILFMVDNSGSTKSLSPEIKTGIRSMVGLVSQNFDYRLIGTELLPSDSTPNDDFQILTNSADSLGSAASKKIISANEVNFFDNEPPKSTDVQEKGLQRGIDFIKANPGLFRQHANLLIVIFSNGRDTDVEKTALWGSAPTYDDTAYKARLAAFKDIKNNLNLRQLRLLSMTAFTNCNGWFSSEKSYVKMANELYGLSGASDSPSRDSYNLCSGVTNMFAAVNESIKKVEIDHQYRYWPINFATNGNVRNDFGTITVAKVVGNVSTPMAENTEWTYYEHTGATPLNIREPAPSEPVLPGGEVAGKHFIKFVTPIVSPPTCIQVKSSTRTEYFSYVVLNQQPKPDTIHLKINGKVIPQSDSNGWTYVGSRMNQNIKAAHPKAGDELPALNKSGFMLQLNGSANYYQSGDSIEANFIAAPL